MKRSQKFTSILKLAQVEELKASSQMQKSLAQLKKLDAALLDLQRYQTEYSLQYQNYKTKSVTVGDLKRFQAFMEQIQKAILQQENMLKKYRLDAENTLNAWLRKQGRVIALRNATETMQQTEEVESERREQSRADEINTNKHRSTE